MQTPLPAGPEARPVAVGWVAALGWGRQEKGNPNTLRSGGRATKQLSNSLDWHLAEDGHVSREPRGAGGGDRK